MVSAILAKHVLYAVPLPHGLHPALLSVGNASLVLTLFSNRILKRRKLSRKCVRIINSAINRYQSIVMKSYTVIGRWDVKRLTIRWGNPKTRPMFGIF